MKNLLLSLIGLGFIGAAIAPSTSAQEYIVRSYRQCGSGTLTGSEGARINVRSYPSVSNGSYTGVYGLTGDRVVVCEVRNGFDDPSYKWYKVTFPSGAVGWVREDLIRLG